MMPNSFHNYEIIVELLCYPLGAVHDAVPPSDIQTDLDAPGQLAERPFWESAKILRGTPSFLLSR
jgi:hypothetical protein